MAGKVLYPNGKPCRCGCGQPAAKNFNKNGVFKGWLRYASGHAPRGAPEEARRRGMEASRLVRTLPVGSRRKSRRGKDLYYWEVKVAMPDVWMLEHRHVVEQMLGRPLTSDEIVHHDDENGLNNDPDNLVLTTRGPHNRHHSKGVKPNCQCECPNCGKVLSHFAKGLRRKKHQVTP